MDKCDNAKVYKCDVVRETLKSKAQPTTIQV